MDRTLYVALVVPSGPGRRRGSERGSVGVCRSALGPLPLVPLPVFPPVGRQSLHVPDGVSV